MEESGENETTLVEESQPKTENNRLYLLKEVA